MTAAVSQPARGDVTTGRRRDEDALIERLDRIEGRVHGIERMVAADRDCIDVIRQIAAARTALEHVGVELLEGHVTHCVADALAAGDAQAAEVKSAEMLDAVQRFVKAL